MELKERVAELSDLLRRYQKAYYVDSRPLVSDLEYDKLFDELVRIENEHPELKSPDSPTARVGSDLTSDFPEVEHTIPVLSLDKAYGKVTAPDPFLYYVHKTKLLEEATLALAGDRAAKNSFFQRLAIVIEAGT